MQQLCPKCNGQGIVSKPPYVAGDVDQWVANETSFKCNLCNGKMVIESNVPQSSSAQQEVNDMTVQEFYSGFNLDFMTAEEVQTIYTATELFASGKVKQQSALAEKEIERLKELLEKVVKSVWSYDPYKEGTKEEYWQQFCKDNNLTP